jgi:hypothetical protein
VIVGIRAAAGPPGPAYRRPEGSAALRGSVGLEPDHTATALLDAGEHVLERCLLGQALQLSSQVLLKGLASLLGPSLEFGMDVRRKVSHLNARQCAWRFPE